MRLTDGFSDWKELYKAEIDIAERELLNSRFTYDQQKVAAEIYALPARNHQTFFSKLVYDRSIFKLFYAKAIQSSVWFSDPIYMYTFVEAHRFKDHPMRKGQIVCGVKPVSKGGAGKLLNILDCLSNTQPENIVRAAPDTELTAIRRFENNFVTHKVAFTDASALSFSENAPSDSAEYLNKLHLYLEEIIGLGTEQPELKGLKPPC